MVMKFHPEINCWVYEGKYMGKDKSLQFVKSILEIIKTRFENDNETDLKNIDFWKEDELNMNRSYGQEIDDLNIELNGANPYLLKSSFCACSQPIRCFHYYTYKRKFTFRVGNDCIRKNIDEEMAKYSKKARKQLIKKLKDKKEKIEEARWLCELGLQKCLDCDGWLPQSDYFVRCPSCFKKFIRK
jgi:hypothetical protein